VRVEFPSVLCSRLGSLLQTEPMFRAHNTLQTIEYRHNRLHGLHCKPPCPAKPGLHRRNFLMTSQPLTSFQSPCSRGAGKRARIHSVSSSHGADGWNRTKSTACSMIRFSDSNPGRRLWPVGANNRSESSMSAISRIAERTSSTRSEPFRPHACRQSAIPSCRR
jgi:hypothetical protein